MNEITLSIIIPAYNAAGFIEEALASLTDQITSGVEVILVDDGSTDRTYELVAEKFSKYIENDSLKIFKQINQGVSAARNFGLAAAKGQFIGFMDADDFIFPGYIHHVISAIHSGADIIEFGFKTFFTNVSETLSKKSYYSNKSFGLNDASDVINKIYAISRWYPWSRVFRSSLFQGIQFPVGVRFCEDLMTIPLLYEKATKINSMPNILYGYRVNQEGATVNVRPDYVENLTQFYSTIPKDGLLRHDYLRMSTAYAIQSCNRKSGQPFNSPRIIQNDLRSLRYSFAVYRDCEFRRILMQLYPTAFKFIRSMKRLARPSLS